MSLKRNQYITLVHFAMLAHCWDCWRVADNRGAFPNTHIPSPVSHVPVSYSADNSWRAISTRSLNVRSRIIWRSTLSTL
jgi:hypothetical protein